MAIFGKDNKDNKENDIDILSRITDRVEGWFDYYSENNERFRNDVKFTYELEGQWTTDEIKEYDDLKKPRLTFNMMPRFLAVIQGEFGQMAPNLKVRALNAIDADQDKINLLTDILREISFKSRNDIVYQTSFNNALTGGYGAYRIVVELEDVFSFNHVIRYKSIQDPTNCFWDPAARENDKHDGKYCGLVTYMSKEEFKLKYPKVDVPVRESDFNQNNFTWMNEEEIGIVEYYEKVPFKREVSLLSNGKVVDSEDAAKIVKEINEKNKILSEIKQDFNFVETKVVDTATRDDFKIKFYRSIKNEILDRAEWDGKRLPIIFQPGFLRWIEGREKTMSFLRWLKDAQKAYNYARSEFSYRLKLTRYEPYLASEKNVEGHETQWNNAYMAKSVLVFKADPNGYEPKRQSAQEIPQSLSLEMNQSYNDLQRISGRFEANLGAPSNEVSGRAITARQRPGNLSVKPFFDNAVDSIESGAIASLDLMQKVMDNERFVTLKKENGDQKQEIINKEGGTQNNIKDGQFNVEVTVGSSFEVQKAEAIEQLIRIVGVDPELKDVAHDLIVENLDLKNTPQFVQRVRKFVGKMPQIIAQESGDPEAIAATSKPNPMQQLAMQAAQQELLINQQKAQDDKVKAMASQITALANMMNAQTNRSEAQVKGVLESKRIQAEEDKANAELQTEALKVLSESEQAGGIF
jgi:hypothetical protein